MFAKYLILATKTQTSPIIVPPWDKVGSDRWVTPSLDIRQVAAAGVVTWGSRDSPDVVCSGEGAFQRSAKSRVLTIRKSRGEVDAELIRQLFNEPVWYVVLNMEGLGERPLILSGEEAETTITRFQGHLARDIVSGGTVLFDVDEGHDPICSGSLQLGNWLKPFTVESRGAEDADLIQQFFVDSLLGHPDSVLL